MAGTSDFPFTPETNPSRRTYTPPPRQAPQSGQVVSPSGLLTGVPLSASRSVGRPPSAYTLIPDEMSGDSAGDIAPSKRTGWTKLGKGGQATVYKTPQGQAARVFALRDPADWESLISDISIPIH